MNVDYIVVGCGLAGIAFCEQLKAHNKRFVMFDDGSQQSSVVAGGLYNPVILKRFTPVWKSKEQLKIALPMYQKMERDFDRVFDYKIPVLRLFHSVEEQNNWFAASDKASLSDWMATQIQPNHNPYIKADFGFGQVLHTGRIDTGRLIDVYQNALKAQGQLIAERFDYKALQIEQSSIAYNTITAQNIVFAEGFGLKRNPFFKQLPLTGTKGELLTIHAPNLKLNAVLKSTVFLIPLGADRYVVGATYNWNDKTNTPTQAAKDELLQKLDTFMTAPYTVVDHVAGIRPTVKDRRPLVGVHPDYCNMYVLNGLGTRGVMIAPYIAKQLFEAIEGSGTLDSEIDITRFKN